MDLRVFIYVLLTYLCGFAFAQDSAGSETVTIDFSEAEQAAVLQQIADNEPATWKNAREGMRIMREENEQLSEALNALINTGSQDIDRRDLLRVLYLRSAMDHWSNMVIKTLQRCPEGVKQSEFATPEELDRINKLNYEQLGVEVDTIDVNLVLTSAADGELLEDFKNVCKIKHYLRQMQHQRAIEEQGSSPPAPSPSPSATPAPPTTPDHEDELTPLEHFVRYDEKRLLTTWYYETSKRKMMAKERINLDSEHREHCLALCKGTDEAKPLVGASRVACVSKCFTTRVTRTLTPLPPVPAWPFEEVPVINVFKTLRQIKRVPGDTAWTRKRNSDHSDVLLALKCRDEPSYPACGNNNDDSNDDSNSNDDHNDSNSNDDHSNKHSNDDHDNKLKDGSEQEQDSTKTKTGKQSLLTKIKNGIKRARGNRRVWVRNKTL